MYMTESARTGIIPSDRKGIATMSLFEVALTMTCQLTKPVLPEDRFDRRQLLPSTVLVVKYLSNATFSISTESLLSLLPPVFAYFLLK